MTIYLSSKGNGIFESELVFPSTPESKASDPWRIVIFWMSFWPWLLHYPLLDTGHLRCPGLDGILLPFARGKTRRKKCVASESPSPGRHFSSINVSELGGEKPLIESVKTMHPHCIVGGFVVVVGALQHVF